MVGQVYRREGGVGTSYTGEEGDCQDPLQMGRGGRSGVQKSSGWGSIGDD